MAMSERSRPAPDAEPESGPTSGTFTVKELCARFQDAIRHRFPDEIWVQGAISGLTRSGNGHVYFDLVDPNGELGRSTDAVVPVALFAPSKHLVNRILRKAGGIRMQDGVEIRIRGRVDYYPPQGRVQLVMSLIDPQFTLGQLVAARAELLERLAAEGLLEANHRRPFPALPLRVALVTSGGSAAFHDFVHQLEVSGYPFRVTLIDSRVQGVDAVPSLTAALDAAADLEVDVVAVVRGGGARTDLVAFDHERVARAIARCRHPVIVGVGHETDRSVADEVAQLSAKTPTASAVALVEVVARFDDALTRAANRLAGLAQLHVEAAQDRLLASGARLVGVAGRVVERNDVELRHAARRLGRSSERVVERADHRLAMARARLSALDPAAALRRGWTITHTESGQLVRSIGQVESGTRLRTTTMDGTIASTVESTDGGARGEVDEQRS